MQKNVKSIFFVLTLVMLLVTVGAACAADDTNSTITASDTIVSEATTITDTTNDKVAAEPVTTESNDNVNTKTIEKEDKNIKKDVKTHIVTNDTISDVFSKEGVSPYNDLGFNSLLLGDNIDDGDILDFQGTIKGNYNLTINKAVNITSSTNNALIDLDTHSGGLLGDDPGNHFIIDIRGSYTNITNINFHNTQIFIYNTSHINIDNITSISEDQRIGGGVGVTSVREGSEYINVKNSNFYVRDNGGSTVFTLSRAQYCTVDNCTFEGVKSGNIFYLNYFNTWSECRNDYNNITNCKITGGTGGISLNVVINGEHNIFKNNTCDSFLSTDSNQGQSNKNNSFIGNTVGSINSFNIINSTIINNTITKILNAVNSTVKNNVIHGVLQVSGGNISENKVYGKVKIVGINGIIFNNTFSDGVNFTNTKTNNYTIILNNITGQLTIQGTKNTVQNNSVIVADDYAITINGRNNIVKDNYLRTIASGGDASVYSRVPGNTIINNTPTINSEIIEINDETYYNYFNEEGFINNEEIKDFSTIHLIGELHDKQFNIKNKNLIIEGLSNSKLINCKITTDNDAHLDIRNITLINTDEINGIIFNSNMNVLQNSTIIFNSNKQLKPIIINGDQINIKNNNITVDSNSNMETYILNLNSKGNKILNNIIHTNTTNNNIIYLNGTTDNSENNIIENNSIYSIDDNVKIITLENSNNNQISKNTIIVNAKGNVTGISLKNGNNNQNNITGNNINITSENSKTIEFSNNNLTNSMSNNFIENNTINSTAINKSIIIQSITHITSSSISANKFYSSGEESIGIYLEGDGIDIYNNFITCVGKSQSKNNDYYNINQTIGMIFINTTNTRIYRENRIDYCNNVTNGYGIILINSTNNLIEEQVITSNLNKTIILINSSKNIINESYIKANKTGGEEAILDINGHDNQYINNTPEIIYLTEANYNSYFTDNVLNYKNPENKTRYTHIILDSDLYNKTMQFNYRIVVENPDNHTLYNCKIIYNATNELMNTFPLDINKYTSSFNNINMVSNNEEYVIKSNTPSVDLTLNNSNIYHENQNMKTHTIEGSINIEYSNITTIGPEIENDDNTPSTVAIIGSSVGSLSFTNITVKYNSYDNKGFISGIYSTANIPNIGSILVMNLNIVGKENVIGIRGLGTISKSQLSMNANNIIGCIRGTSYNIDSTKMTLTGNNKVTGIIGNYSGNLYLKNSNINLKSNNSAVLMNESFGNCSIQNTTIKILANNTTFIISENSSISISDNSTFNSVDSEITNIISSKNDTLKISSSTFNIYSTINTTMTIIDSKQTIINNNTFIVNSAQNTRPIILNTDNTSITNNYLESKNYQGNEFILNNGENTIENNRPNNDGEYKIKINTNKDSVILNKENTIKINITNMLDENITGKITVTSNNQIIPIIDNTITWTPSRETFNPPTTTFTNIINNQNLTTIPSTFENTIINNTTINSRNNQSSNCKIMLFNNSLLNMPIRNQLGNEIYIYNSILNGSYSGIVTSTLYVDENTIIGENFKILVDIGNSYSAINIFTNNKQLLEILEKNDIEPINKPTLTFTYTDPEGKYNTTTISKTFTILSPTLKVDPITATVGQTINITARITADDETITDINKGKITFKVNGKTLKDANGKVIYAKVVNGTATIENYLVPSDWAKEGTTIQAVYSGSSECDKLTSEKTEITIQKAVPILTTKDITATTGDKITLKATITDNNKVINTGKIVFKINGKTVKDENGKVIYAKIVNNIVEFEYTLPNSYKAGSYNITATFISADYDRLTDSKTLTITT